MGISILYAVWIFFGIYGVTSQGDSLRSALNAVDRRQKYLFSNYPDVFYSRENNDLNYLPDSVSAGGNELTDYLSDGDIDLGKQISSPFRERLEEDREKQLEELSQRFLQNLQSDGSFNYQPRDPWQKYRNNPSHGSTDRISHRKRQFYPDFGYDSIGLRKRDQFGPPSEYPNDLNYYTNNNEDYPSSDYIDTYEYSKRSSPYLDDRYERSRPYWSFKHIPVAKRSSEYISKDVKKPQTDPKVEKDLSSIFNDGKVEKNSTTTKINATNKEVMLKSTSEPSTSEKPIKTTKKSVDWSEYFGLDRRKKSQGINKEWLMERYHKAVSKKNSEPLKQEGAERVKKNKDELDETKLENMDRKLKILEDDIVDDALKYTGANEGTNDPKEIQEVRDGLISRLAKAYSIEKMRRALGEYKMLVDREREKLTDNENAELATYEEKRVSVPRKQAVDPNKEVQIEDNHIKCTQGTDCDEENYRTPIEVIEQMNYEVGGCPKIQRDCNEVAPLLGQYSRIFEEACSIHQMCLLCGNNNWYPTTRQCNIIFLSKVSDMCEGKTDCQKELQKSVRYLMNINKNLRNNPTGECDLVCPDNADVL